MLIDRGRNIHSQSGDFEPAYLPQHRIRSMDDLGPLLGQDIETHLSPSGPVPVLPGWISNDQPVTGMLLFRTSMPFKPTE